MNYEVMKEYLPLYKDALLLTMKVAGSVFFLRLS